VVLILASSASFLLFLWNKINQIQNTNQELYFAYGSNMNTDQMKERCGNGFKAVGPAQLNNYEFGFDKNGYANIRPKQGEYVWGFIWEIETSCIKSLDQYENYPNTYNRENVSVTKNGQNLNVFVYIQSAEKFGGAPLGDYLNNKIIPGAKENKLPQEWIRKLEQYNSNPIN
jgi:gamma-glutamylcyclotransferase (GGCT)/AIG2-like uncharacterized protein YtfP